MTMVYGFTGLQLQHFFSLVPTCNEKAMAYRFTGLQLKHISTIISKDRKLNVHIKLYT